MLQSPNNLIALLGQQMTVRCDCIQDPLRGAEPECVADATTPTASAGDFYAKLEELKSPLAKGDTASIIGSPDGIEGADIELPCLGEATSGSGSSNPDWLRGLITAKLFDLCPHHPGVRKNETNFFCLGCTGSTGMGMCKHCLPHHCCGSPTVFQVRRYMYQNVVHVDDLNPLFEVSGIQAYCINGKRAVLISPKPPAAGLSGPPVFANRCQGCKIPLRPDCTWCSLSCKAGLEGHVHAPRTPHERGHSTGEHATMRLTQYFRTKEERSSFLSSRASPSDASTTTRMGVKRRKVDTPARSHLF